MRPPWVMGAGGTGDLLVTVKLKDVAGTVKSQGGATGALAQMLAPHTIEKTVYDKIASKLKAGFTQQGVDADVTVMDAAAVPGAPAKSTEFLRGAAVGVGAVGGGYLIYKYAIKRLIGAIWRK